MFRRIVFGLAAMGWLAGWSLGGLVSAARADAFDEYTLPLVAAAPGKDGVREVGELTPELIVAHSQVLPHVEGAMVLVATNDHRWAKMLVLAARHKFTPPGGGEPQFMPVFRIERFVTFREGGDRSVQASGQGISLFAGFRFHLDWGQVVPEALGGDLQVVAEPGKKLTLRPVGQAKIYLLTQPLPEAAPRGVRRLESGEKFQAEYFTGVYRLHDDGRRSGVLRLTVGEGGDITGTLVSDANGREYPVTGSIGRPNYKIQFTVQFPQTQQEFTGFMFTGNGKAIAGISKMEEREAGFYAVRLESTETGR